jgi:hypothetical protein
MEHPPMFVIWNTTQRAYVAPAGGATSYTRRIEAARKWPTREAADRECCGDERVRDACEVLRG